MLTESRLKRMLNSTRPCKISDSGGLYIDANGSSMKWRIRYKSASGTDTAVTIGSYPEMSLESARKELALFKEKQESRTVTNLTFGAVANEWFERFSVTLQPSHAHTIRQRMDKWILGLTSETRLHRMKATDILRVIRRIEGHGINDTAHRCLTICSQIFRYAVACGYVDSDCTRDLRGALTPARHVSYPILTGRRDIGMLIRHINFYCGAEEVRLCLRMLAYTFVRPNEIRYAKWDEFDMDNAMWRIPKERMKGRREHLVPLSRQCIAVLEAMKCISGNTELVFPSPLSGRRDKPVSENTLGTALTALGYKGKFVAHSFRGMASTLLNEKGYDPDWIEAQLSHVVGSSVRRAYNRALYLEQRAMMMQEYADILDDYALNPTM